MGRSRPGSCSLITAASVCWAVFMLVAILVVHGRTAAWDAGGLTMFREPVTLNPTCAERSIAAIYAVTSLGGYVLRNLAALLALTVLAATRHRAQVTMLLLTIASGWCLELSLKEFFSRPRPEDALHLVAVYGTSFPSGHAFNAAVVFVGIALATMSLTDVFWKRCTILFVAVGSNLLIGITRIMLGVHFPTDIIAGLFGGTGWAFLMFGLFSGAR